jgi:hypothetical protein
LDDFVPRLREAQMHVARKRNMPGRRCGEPSIGWLCAEAHGNAANVEYVPGRRLAVSRRLSKKQGEGAYSCLRVDLPLDADV